MLYLHGESPAIDAVFRACRSIILAPVKLHLLGLKAPRQRSASDEVVILQENGNWRQRGCNKKESRQTEILGVIAQRERSGDQILQEHREAAVAYFKACYLKITASFSSLSHKINLLSQMLT